MLVIVPFGGRIIKRFVGKIMTKGGLIGQYSRDWVMGLPLNFGRTSGLMRIDLILCSQNYGTT